MAFWHRQEIQEPGELPPADEAGSRLHWPDIHPAKYIATGAALPLVAAFAVAGYLNREDPPIIKGPADELPRPDDGVLRVVSWNMHREAAEHLPELCRYP